MLEVDLPHLQRGLRRHRRRRRTAARAGRRRAAAGAHARESHAARSRGARPRRVDGDSGFADARARRAFGRADSAARSRPRQVESPAHSDAGLKALARAERLGALGPYALASRDRRLSCARAQRLSNRLGAHRRALRRARGTLTVAGGRAQSRRRGRHGVRRASRTRDRRRAARRAVAAARTICCRACAAICSSSSGAGTKRARSSSARHRSPATTAIEPSCSSAPVRRLAQNGNPRPNHDASLFSCTELARSADLPVRRRAGVYYNV